MKKAFRNIAIAALLTAVAGWFAWSATLRIGPGEHGEFWTEWSRTIDVIWTIIPVAFGVSLLSTIGWVVTPPRSARSLGWAAGLIALTLSVAGWFAFVLTHLGIK